MDRAMEAGIDDVGIGILFDCSITGRSGPHAAHRHLETQFGVGRTPSARLEPALNADIASHPPHPSDIDFRKIVAILRLAIPIPASSCPPAGI